MVTYLASGDRNYNTNPMAPYARWSWEVIAIQKGSVRLWLGDQIHPVEEKTLLVFPPGHVHGWKGAGGKALVAIVHIEDMPEPVGSWITEQGWFSLPLTPANSKRFQELHDWASRNWTVFDALRDLRWKRLAYELANMVGELVNRQRLTLHNNRDALLVENAIRLFSEHLAEGWNLEQVCAKLPVSLAQLRRLFVKVLHVSPRKVFEDIRFRKAMELIMVPHVKLENVAIECGYQSLAAFSRAFKRQCYIYPSQWQKDAFLRKRAKKQYDDSKWADEFKRLQYRQQVDPSAKPRRGRSNKKA